MPERKRKGLTARFVETVARPGRYYDNGGMGLFLRVRSGGSKQWVQRIMVQGRRVEPGLGSPPVVTLAKARERALANKRIAYDGGAPMAKRHGAREALTFEAAARKAHVEISPTFKNPKDGKAFLATLEAHAFSRFGAKAVGEVTSADVRQAVLAVRARTPEVARKLALRVSAVFKWCITERLRPDNPATAEALALPKLGKVRAHRKALPHAEVAGCIAAVQASGAWPATKLALEFLVLTAARSGEVRGATWDEIDFGAAAPANLANSANPAAVWEIPAARMKMQRPHRVPLAPRAVEILRAAAAFRDGSGLVFPSPRGRPLSDMTLSKLVKELGFAADVHGFRTSFRTWAQECSNHPREVAEAALAHAVGDAVERAYARSDVFERRRRLMAQWAAYLAARRGEVVALGAAR
jgi:integrase